MVNGKIVLVADDSEDDFLLLRAAFRKARLPHQLFHVLDGDHAIMYLEGVAPFSDRHHFPFPDLLILDVQMPHGNGFEVLSHLRGRQEIQLPVIMFSGSSIIQDIQMGLQLGAVRFFTKPVSLKGMAEMAQTIHDCWLAKADGKKGIVCKREPGNLNQARSAQSSNLRE